MAISPGTYNISLQRRADYSITLQFKDSNDAAINLTGWTVAANASIATTAKEGNRRVIAVVLGCNSPGGSKAAQRLRDKLAADLMTDGFAKLAAKPAPVPKPVGPPAPTPAAPKKPIIVKKEPSFWEWLSDLFSF